MYLAEQRNIRESLAARLRSDLLGPIADDETIVHDKETGEGDTPLSRYLVGILYPAGAVVSHEEDDSANEGGDGEEDQAPEEPVIVTGIPKPSSIGLSFAVGNDVRSLVLKFRYGLYSPFEYETATVQATKDDAKKPPRKQKPKLQWKRTQVAEEVRIKIPASGSKLFIGGGKGEWHCRQDTHHLAVSVFLRNSNSGGSPSDEPEQCIYQPEILIEGEAPGDLPIINRAHQTDQTSFDPDLESYRLLYRDKPEFAVGHGCATEWDCEDSFIDRAKSVRTQLLPLYEVPTTEAMGGLGIEGLNMEALVTANNGEEIRSALIPLVDQYDAWIAAKRKEIPLLPKDLQHKGLEHLDDCHAALRRIKNGLALISQDALVCEAFQFANLAMLLQRKKSVEATNFQNGKGRIYDAPAPRWRPFQIAFILLNLSGIAEPHSDDREIVDLLWFPTGGGKTEAYLGLSAFTMGLRRLRNISGRRMDATGDGGVTVLMRYTLRLLTIQQFQRASTLICACEILRRQHPEKFGQEPFSIGLWVGGGATPNSIDQKPDPRYGIGPGALQVLENFNPNDEPAEGNPVQLRSCPWCGESLTYNNYHVIREYKHLQISCPNDQCEFHAIPNEPKSGIPAYVVDEDIYFRCPTLLIGTVDKFARLPWDDRTKALFGRVDRRCQRHDFLSEGVDYEGKCGGRHNASGIFPGTALPTKTLPFLPPELIIQDELHLITGPLGSLMGLYEGAVDFLCSQIGARPKVVASTATIRRFLDQIKSLFDRDARQFPPPGLIAGESFFAAENRSKPGRLYVGLCTPGKSMKTAAIRTLASLMHTAWCSYKHLPPDAVDPYWTVVYYFNSLRELGGALRLIDDDVRQRLTYLANSEGITPPRVPDKHRELTSRIPARDVTKLLKQMESSFSTGDALDLLLCTNMISVGIDIQRFGLMLVTGQPKTSAEYIQATSRVGRQTPGAIFTLYNWSRPRDLSHYERFLAYHSMLYRHVEASSVTPYSSRARDKGLHGVFIGLVRLLGARMSNNDGARNFDVNDPLVRQITEYLLERVRNNDSDEYDDARERLKAFIDGWAGECERHGNDLRYRAPGGSAEGALPTWLLQPAEEGSGDEFPKGTLNSLREVEKSSGLYFKNFRKYGSRS